MPDSMVDFSPVLEETADVPEELVVRCRPPMTEQMQTAQRAPLQAFSMNDCQVACGPSLADNAGWVAFNKIKLQELFEATLTEMTAEPRGPSIPDEMEHDEKENACVPQPDSPVSSVESAQSPSVPSTKSDENRVEEVNGASTPSSPIDLAKESESLAGDTTPSKKSRKRKEASPCKGDSIKDTDRWVALNKNVVFDMIDSAMQQPLEGLVATKEPEVLDLSTKAFRKPQVEEPAEPAKGHEDRVPSSPAEKKTGKRKKTAASATCSSAKRRRETSKKATKSTKKATKENREQKLHDGASINNSPVPHVNSASDDDSGPKLGLSVGASSDSLGKGALPQCSSVKGQRRRRVSADIDPAAGRSPPAPSSASDRVSGCRSPVKCSAKSPRQSQESPKHGWVALSKADVHTIVDSVVTSGFLEETGAPSSVPSAREASPPATPVPQSRSSARRVSFASVDQLAKGSPPDSPATPLEDCAHLNNRPFKWKSNMMMRAQGADQSCPPSPLE